MSTLAVPVSRLSQGLSCKKQRFTEVVLYAFRGRCLLFFGGLGNSFLFFAALETRLKVDEVSGENRIQSEQASGAK